MAVGVGLAILVVSHLPKGVLPRTGLHYRVEHALAYGTLAAAWVFALRKRRVVVRAVITLCIIGVLGAVDELSQPLVGRQCGALDWLTDLAAASVAVGLWVLFHWGRRWLAAGVAGGGAAEGGEHARGS